MSYIILFVFCVLVIVPPVLMALFERFKWPYVLLAAYIGLAGYTIGETENLPIGLGLFMVALVVFLAGEKPRPVKNPCNLPRGDDGRREYR